LDDEPGLSGGLGEGLLETPGLACDPPLEVGDGCPISAVGVSMHCVDLTTSDLTSEQPTEVVTVRTTPTRPRVSRVTTTIAATRR